jgi:hypothetical protein
VRTQHSSPAWVRALVMISLAQSSTSASAEGERGTLQRRAARTIPPCVADGVGAGLDVELVRNRELLVPHAGPLLSLPVIGWRPMPDGDRYRPPLGTEADRRLPRRHAPSHRLQTPRGITIGYRTPSSRHRGRVASHFNIRLHMGS